LIVDIDVTKDMRRSAPAGIEATFFRSEPYAGKSKGKDISLLPRRELAPQPLEAAVHLELLVGLPPIQARNDDGEFLHHFVGVDDATGVRVEGNHVQVGSQKLAIAIDDVGPGGNSVGIAKRTGGGLLGKSVLDKTAADQNKPADEGADQNA